MKLQELTESENKTYKCTVEFEDFKGKMHTEVLTSPEMASTAEAKKWAEAKATDMFDETYGEPPAHNEYGGFSVVSVEPSEA